MIEATAYPDEANRLAALHATRLLDTPIEERFERITRMVCRVLDVPIALFNLIDEDRQHYKSVQGLANTNAPLQAAFCTHAIAEEDMLLVPNAALDERFHDNPFVTGEYLNIGFYAGCPIRTSNGMPVGTLCAIDTRPRDMSDEQLATLRDLAAMVETELTVSSLCKAQARLTEELTQAKMLALVDPLTRLWNRDGIGRLLDKEWAEATRQGKPVSVAMADIDLFKKINDTFGHATGDAVLRVVAKRFLQALRAEDAVGRFGGEEFLIILTDCPPDDVTDVVERVRRAIADEPVSAGEATCHVTMSFGVAATVPGAGGQSANLIKRADDALYQAKRNGRNRVEVAPHLSS